MLIILLLNLTTISTAFSPVRIHAHKVSTVPYKVTHDRNCKTNHQLNFPCYKVPTARASVLANVASISLASTVGLISEKLRFLSGSAGSVIALLVSALISNIFSFQIEDNVIDLCWECLPASLAFLLLSPSKENLNEKQSNSSLVKDTVFAMSAPFFLGSIGSILGCIISAFLCSSGSNNASIFQMTTKYHSIIAAGCLVSSYIGGSVNFFATANIIKSQMTHIFPSGFTKDINNLLTAMATADLMVMAVYFALLFSMHSFKSLQKAFPGRNNNYTENGLHVKSIPRLEKDTFSSYTSNMNQSLVLSSIASSALVWWIVNLSNLCERSLSSFVPGFGCASVAILTTLCRKALKLMANTKEETMLHNVANTFEKDLEIIGPIISNLCFMVIFAAIGLTANLQRAIQHGLSSLTFASIALVIHIIVIMSGSWLLSNGIPKTSFTSRFFPLNLAEVLVASNANIGGASTAAAFASKISTERYQRPLILGATFWGVTGYAIATNVGLVLIELLLKLL